MGGETLDQIAADPDMPSKTTILRWVQEDRDGFRDQYARAREMQAHTLMDEGTRIARAGMAMVDVTNEDGQVVNRVPKTHPGAVRNILWWYQKKCAAMAPKKWGNHIDVTATIEDNTGVLEVPVRISDIDEWAASGRPAKRVENKAAQPGTAPAGSPPDHPQPQQALPAPPPQQPDEPVRVDRPRPGSGGESGPSGVIRV
jgi:hypothetical protein